VQELMRRIEYERKVSASLYALNGVSECLKMRLGGTGTGRSTKLFSSTIIKNKNRLLKLKQQRMARHVLAATATRGGGEGVVPSAESGVDDGDVLWSSLDLAPLW
jgi:EREBP-like factor